MYELMVSGSFSAAHHLEGYNGECSRPHGHNFKVEVIVWGDGLDQVGMVIDFRKLKRILKDILSELDHTYLNELPQFKEINPTSENIARYIYEALSKRLKGVKKVKIFEKESVWASYSEGAILA